MECEGNRHISKIIDFEFDSFTQNYNQTKEKVSRYNKNNKNNKIDYFMINNY